MIRFLPNPGRTLLSLLTLPLLRQYLFLCLGLRSLVRRPPLISLRLLLLALLPLVVEEGVPLGTKTGRVLLLVLRPSRIARGRLRLLLAVVLSLLAVLMRNFLVGRVFANRSHFLAQQWLAAACLPVGQLGKTGGGCLGGAGSAGGVYCYFSHSSSFVAGTSHPSFVLSPVHQGESAGVGDSGSVAQRCNRAGVHDSGVLQSHVCSDQGVRRVEARHRPLHPEQLCGENPLPDGDHSVGSSVNSSERLDVFSEPEGRLPSGSDSSFESLVPAGCSGGQNLAVSGSFFLASPQRLRFSPG